jgi:hypothetical protein
MYAFRYHVVRQDQVANHGDIVIEPARSRIRRQEAQPVDESELAKAHCISDARMLNILPL